MADRFFLRPHLSREKKKKKKGGGVVGGVTPIPVQPGRGRVLSGILDGRSR